ncbi:hypothetical protein [Nocardia elegans]|uniref:hypothetical protein n=1 Tax=Nocardia elegans TaxID=300029 RepID=UPI001E3C2070|nr:hypothetical protein [Nocardia elegans]
MVDDIGLVPHISLAAAADCTNGTFAVCGDEGRALWYGPFLDSDADHPHGDRFAGTMAAAARAVWLAGRARADAGHSEATLHLVLTDPDVDTVTLACAAAMSGLVLDLVISEDNPALDWWQPRLESGRAGESGGRGGAGRAAGQASAGGGQLPVCER